MLGHHTSCGGLLVRPITTIVIPVGRLLVDDHEFLATAFRLLNLVFPELLEEVHDAGHSLRVRLRPFRSSKHLRNRLAIDDESSRGLLSVIASIMSDETVLS